MLEYRSAGVLGLKFITPVFQSLLIFETHFRAKVLAVLVGLEARSMNAVTGKLLIALLCISGDADSADDLTVLVADQHAPALRKNLIVGSTD
jgi:hypothetical protein